MSGTIFIDVDTQIDFMFPAGALYVPGAEAVLPRIAGLNRHAAAHGFPLISTTDAHSENDAEFRIWPSHCVRGTVGQLKPAATLIDDRQILFPKVVNDAFADGKLNALLDELGASRYVLYGVVTEICVKCVAVGLLARPGAEVHLVSDAVRSLRDSDADAFLSDFTAAGGRLTTASAIL